MKPELANDYKSPEWKGYDIDELRFRRAYLLARCEIEKIKFTSRLTAVKEGIPSIKGNGIAGRMLKGLNYIDYAYIAFKTFSKLSGLFKRVRNRR